MMEPIVFDQRDGRMFVDRWPQYVAFSTVLLETADPNLFTRDGDVVTVTATSGSARYRLLDPLVGNDPLELVPIRAIKIDG